MRWLPLLLLVGCSTPELGMDYGATRLPIVDMHLHTGEWEDIPSSTQRFLAERFPFPLGLDAEGTASGVLEPEGVVRELDKGGVSHGVLLAVYAPRSVGVATNEGVIENIAAAPDRLWGLASLRVDRWNEDRDEQLQKLRDALAAPGMIGIKLAHAHMHFRMDDPDYYGIYEIAAELGKPVYLHTGPSPFPGTNQEPPYTDPAYLEEAIQQHPGAIFILGHLGFDFLNDNLGELDTCIRLAQTYANVYLEPSAMGSRGGDPDQVLLPEAMRRIREGGVADRVIYGSDGPQSPGFVKEYAERTLYAMEQAGWSEAEAEAAMSGTFAQVFGVEAPSL
jgi:predicted TIM-barrel fold metal-dependent hydrolase